MGPAGPMKMKTSWKSHQDKHYVTKRLKAGEKQSHNNQRVVDSEISSKSEEFDDENDLETASSGQF